MKIGILKIIISSKSDFSFKTDGLAKLSAPVSEYSLFPLTNSDLSEDTPGASER